MGLANGFGSRTCMGGSGVCVCVWGGGSRGPPLTWIRVAGRKRVGCKSRLSEKSGGMDRAPPPPPASCLDLGSATATAKARNCLRRQGISVLRRGKSLRRPDIFKVKRNSHNE